MKVAFHLRGRPGTPIRDGPHAWPMAWTAPIRDGHEVSHVDAGSRQPRRRYLAWRPTLPEGNTLRSVPLAWLQVDPERLELAGIDREGGGPLVVPGDQ